MTGLWKFCIGALAALGLLAALAGSVLAQGLPPAELMADANRSYERGEFAEAAQQYEALIGLGYLDAAVYFNLGNAYLESGDLGRAVLSYLRAEELSPRDPDILANLELARSRTVDRLEAEGDSLVASVSDLGRRLATTVEFGAAALLLWAAGALAVSALILWPALPRRAILRSGAVCRLCRHAGTAGAAAEYAVLQPLRKHRGRNRRDCRGPQRAGAAVRRGVRPAQRRPGASQRQPPRLAAGGPAGRRATGLGTVPRYRVGWGGWRPVGRL